MRRRSRGRGADRPVLVFEMTLQVVGVPCADACRRGPDRRRGRPPIDQPFGKDHTGHAIANNRHPMIECGEQCEVQVDVDDDHRHPIASSRVFDGLQRRLAERATVSRDELDAGCAHAVTIFAPGMRPFTAFIVVGLMVIIVVAFVIKLQTSGFTP